MRRAMLLPCVLLAIALQAGCSREQDFDERYDAATNKLDKTAKQIDADLEKRAAEAAPVPSGTPTADEGGLPPGNGA